MSGAWRIGVIIGLLVLVSSPLVTATVITASATPFGGFALPVERVDIYVYKTVVHVGELGEVEYTYGGLMGIVIALALMGSFMAALTGSKTLAGASLVLLLLGLAALAYFAKTQVIDALRKAAKMGEISSSYVVVKNFTDVTPGYGVAGLIVLLASLAAGARGGGRRVGIRYARW